MNWKSNSTHSIMNSITLSPFGLNTSSASLLSPSRRQRNETTVTSTREDRVLVSRFQNGDESAFEQIVERHRQRVHGYIRRLVRNEADAEEVTQDTFVRAYRYLARFRGDASLATWLHRIATNLARNHYWYFFRRCRHTTFSMDQAPGGGDDRPISESFASDAPDPCQQSAKTEFETAVRNCVESIDPIFRESLELRAAKGLSYAEISKKTGVPVGTVKSRIARARADLRKLLTETVPEFDANALNDCFENGRS